jgi:hypothetical protein
MTNHTTRAASRFDDVSSCCRKSVLVLIKRWLAAIEMYTCLACLVLFDARGGELQHEYSTHYYAIAAACLSVFLLTMAYIPHIFHRPLLVDAFCADVLSIVTHVAVIGVFSDLQLRHACALHSACLIIQTRFLDVKNTIQPILLHTVLVLLLLASYVYCPRITEIKQFVIGAVFPHVLELVAKCLASVHGVLVTFWLEKGT